METRMQVINLFSIHIACMPELLLQLSDSLIFSLDSILKLGFSGLEPLIHIIKLFFLEFNKILKLFNIILKMEINLLEIFLHLLSINFMKHN